MDLSQGHNKGGANTEKKQPKGQEYVGSVISMHLLSLAIIFLRGLSGFCHGFTLNDFSFGSQMGFHSFTLPTLPRITPPTQITWHNSPTVFYSQQRISISAWPESSGTYFYTVIYKSPSDFLSAKLDEYLTSEPTLLHLAGRWQERQPSRCRRRQVCAAYRAVNPVVAAAVPTVPVRAWRSRSSGYHRCLCDSCP